MLLLLVVHPRNLLSHARPLWNVVVLECLCAGGTNIVVRATGCVRFDKQRAIATEYAVSSLLHLQTIGEDGSLSKGERIPVHTTHL